jgi:hypothetical protein
LPSSDFSPPYFEEKGLREDGPEECADTDDDS